MQLRHVTGVRRLARVRNQALNHRINTGDRWKSL
jgi:hypothetical protein